MTEAGPALRCILLTGVSRGLGLALARSFVDLGHTVIGCARPSPALVAAREELGQDHLLSAVDVASDADVSLWAKMVLDRFGPPDLLINNAAVINRNRPLWQISATEFDHVLAVNVAGSANILRHFLPSMIKASHGVIVNFSSGWGRSVSAEVAPYCATKWAIEGLTRALAEELPDGMCAVPLNPGIINTEMLQSCFAAGAESYPSPDAWARRAVPFILSLGPQHNGQSLSVPD